MIICPKTKQFTDIIVCAANCTESQYCEVYKQKISLEILENFVENNPNYELKGELMASKQIAKGKKLWILDKNDQVKEIDEKEVLENPKKYMDVQIWDKPTYKYELIIKLKRVRVD